MNRGRSRHKHSRRRACCKRLLGITPFGWGRKKPALRVEDLLGLASGVSYTLQNEEVDTIVNMNVTHIARLAEARKRELDPVDLAERDDEALSAQKARLPNQGGPRKEIASIDPLEDDGYCKEKEPQSAQQLDVGDERRDNHRGCADEGNADHHPPPWNEAEQHGRTIEVQQIERDHAR